MHDAKQLRLIFLLLYIYKVFLLIIFFDLLSKMMARPTKEFQTYLLTLYKDQFFV